MLDTYHLTDALCKIEALAGAAGYLYEHEERDIQIALIEIIEQIASKALTDKPVAEGAR
ncbi:TPA: hypothetical protein LVN29_002647 [Klebsiella michiganensis]|nr:hypothetical protein [Klebsiella michiganensis]